MKGRVGKIFEMGFPYLANHGVVYDWPDNREERNRGLTGRREELAECLKPKLRQYLEEWKVSGLCPSYPYVQSGMNALVFHFGSNGRWIEVDSKMAGGFLAFHNLDAWNECASGFNLGSDVIEFFDKEIRCPRIKKLTDKIEIEYFLPKGETNLPINSVPALTKKEIYGRFFEVGKIRDIELDVGESYAEYRFSDGRIRTEDGICRAEIKNGWNISGVTFVMAKLLDSFKFGR